jgi:4-amino-4-deoxy-L-arabinose transferase-like glycosyltransferase
LQKSDLAIVVALAAVFLFLFRSVPSSQPYLYDEADYITAGSRGLAANLLEQPSMSVVEFLQTGLNRTMQSKRASLSDVVRGQKDITFYRHYHGPLYYYWLAVIGPLFQFGEYAMRFSGLVLHVITFAIIYFGVLILSGSRIAALLSGCLFLFGQSNIGTDVQITPHVPYVLFTILTLLLFARYLQTGNATTWYASVVSFACAFCSIDYAILLPITVAACLLVFPERRLALGALLRSLLLFLGCVLALWPLGLLKLSAIKGYFYIAYLAMERKGSYGDDTPWNVWLRRFSDSPVEYALGISCLLIFAVSFLRRRERPLLLPFFVYAGLMLLTTLKNTSLNPTYVSSILPALAVISGIVIASLSKNWAPAARVSAAVLLLIAIAAGGYQVVRRHEAGPMFRPEEGIMASLRDSHMERAVVLVPYQYLPAISYYFPEMQVHAFLSTDGPDALLDKVRDYGAQAIVDGGQPAADLSSKLAKSFSVRAEPVIASPGYVLLHIDGRI